MSDDPKPNVGAAKVNAAPGSTSTVCPSGATCSAYGGEFNAEYGRLNGLSMTVEMPDLLTELTKAPAEHLSSLRTYVWQAPNVDNGRLATAMDAVWYRNIDTHISEGPQLVQNDIETFLKFEVDQRAAINKYMAAPFEKREAARAKRAAIAAAATGGDPFPDSVLSDLDTPEKTQFKKDVYNSHVAAAKARGRKFNMGLDASDLSRIEAGMMHKAAAPVLTSMMAQMRLDLKAARDAGDTLALEATSITIGSAYRGAVEELGLWQRYFTDYYTETASKREAADGGEHGRKAVQIMVDRYNAGKAAPGFGNHTAGIAVDFNTVQGKLTLGTNMSQNPMWITTWIYLWLAGSSTTPGHGKDFSFARIPTEAWHWEYHP